MASRTIEGPGQDLLTASEVAHYLRMEVRTLRRLVEEGEFPRPQASSPKTQLWSWEDVVYYRLRMSLRTRLRRSRSGRKKPPPDTPAGPEKPGRGRGN